MAGIGSRLFRCLCVAICLLAGALPARAVDVRIATMNVCDMAGGSDKAVSAFSNIIQRIQPDCGAAVPDQG